MRMKTACVAICLIISIVGRSQECPGGLGDNLFEDGDFGTGVPFAIQNDPQIAPGYSYVTDGPPNDGSYIITNDMNQWSFNYGSWLVIGDNSNDPDGYMMVVNASFEPGLFYEEEIEGLCDNTQYEFSADIINLIRRTATDHSDPNVDFLINDKVVLTTGNILKTEDWNAYSFSFDTEPGQTSLKLSLRNNAPGGRGNDLALDNISFRACGPRSEVGLVSGDVIVCEEDLPLELVALLDGIEDDSRVYEWQVSNDGMNTWSVINSQNESKLSYSEIDATDLAFRFETAASPQSFQNIKCRFRSDPFEIRISQRIHEVFDTICGGTSIELDGTDIIEPGLYRRDLTSSLNCDSIIMIHLDTVRREVIDGSVLPQDPLCFGSANGIVEGINPQGGYAPYHITINDQSYNSLLANDLKAGTYDVLIEDRFNCFKSFEVALNNPAKLEVDLGPDLNIFLGEEITLDAASNQILEKVKWSSPLESFEGQTSFLFLPLDDLNVKVEGISEQGCIALDTLNVKVDTDVNIYIPNIFSPNEDLKNDDYYISPFGKSLGEIEYFNIYDRFGGLVWASIDGDAKWDGRDENGNKLSVGVYTYILVASLINGDPVKRAGTITII